MISALRDDLDLRSVDATQATPTQLTAPAPQSTSTAGGSVSLVLSPVAPGGVNVTSGTGVYHSFLEITNADGSIETIGWWPESTAPVSNLEAEIDNPYDIQDFQQNPGLQFSVQPPEGESMQEFIDALNAVANSYATSGQNLTYDATGRSH